MINFDGVSIDSVAPVKIEDIRVYPIELDPVTRDRPIHAGSEFVRIRKRTRTIAVTFAVLIEDKTERQAALLALSKWAKTDKEYRLELPFYQDMYLTAACTGKPEPSLRQWWESKLRLVFTCINDPYWNAKAEKSVSCGSDFFVLGDAVPLMRIERTLSADASNQSYAFGGNTMTFSTIPTGDMVIDLNRQTAKVGTTSIMQYFAQNGHFIEPKTGAMKITGTGTVKYRERWC